MPGTTDRTSEGTSAHAIRDVLQAVDQILEAAHVEHVAGLSIRGDLLAIQPSRLADGEDIARALGLTAALDHIHAEPPITDWTGDVAGLEVHVRAALRALAGRTR
jgi:hypothetical protein